MKESKLLSDTTLLVIVATGLELFGSKGTNDMNEQCDRRWHS